MHFSLKQNLVRGVMAVYKAIHAEIKDMLEYFGTIQGREHMTAKRTIEFLPDLQEKNLVEET